MFKKVTNGISVQCLLLSLHSSHNFLLQTMVRNAGKFGKAKRGGGRHFSRDLSRLDADGNPEGGDKNASSDESSSEESSSEEDIQQRVGQLPPIDQSDEEDNIPGLARNLNSTLSTVAREPVDPDAAPAVSNSRLSARTAESIAQARKERKAAQGTKKAPNAAGGSKAKGSDDESSAEENENQQKNKMMKASDLGAPREMSRREKEQADKIAAKERYAKLHAAGKTDEAKADLGRLAEVRKQRELAANQRKAEAEAREVSHKAAMEKSGKKQALKR